MYVRVRSAAWCAAGGWLRLSEVCGAELGHPTRYTRHGDSGGTGARQPTHTLPGMEISTVSFSKVVLSQGAVNQVFLGVFLMFLAFFHSKIWAQFHFGTFKPYK